MADKESTTGKATPNSPLQKQKGLHQAYARRQGQGNQSEGQKTRDGKPMLAMYLPLAATEKRNPYLLVIHYICIF